ncbi:MAG TPA: glycosyltransferase [Dokdonella sp.]|nr:glycosyltransferase [Dokdonella sp.]
MAEAFAQPRWDGQRLEIPPAWGPRVALDIDGHWFCDIEADGDGRLGLDLPFTPSGRDEFSPCIRSARDGEVLWPREIGTAPCSFAAHDDGSRRVAFEAEPMRAEVVVIVPVYNAPDAVRACLDSVLAHTSGRTRLLVIDDASTDPAIALLLAGLEGRPGVRVLANARNLGFTATANRGIAEAGDADVVLLNADTVVGPNWLTGLRRAVHAGDAIATATAVSDNAGAFSVPELERANPPPPAWSVADTARALWQQAGHAYPELPTGNGFCLYIRRAVIDAVGMLDEAAFPQGYGEENDFCQRASARGWRHVIAGNVFVHHARSQSFGAERRQALGRAGMAVLRERWPDYEREVGATLHSFARRVLDWRVRRCYALAERGWRARPRALVFGAVDAVPTAFEAWQADWRDAALIVTHDDDGATREERIGTDAASLAAWLEYAAIELVDLGEDASPAAVALRVQAQRLGIAVTDVLASAGTNGYTVAVCASRSFPDPRA